MRGMGTCMSSGKSRRNSSWTDLVACKVRIFSRFSFKERRSSSKNAVEQRRGLPINRLNKDQCARVRRRVLTFGKFSRRQIRKSFSLRSKGLQREFSTNILRLPVQIGIKPLIENPFMSFWQFEHVSQSHCITLSSTSFWIWIWASPTDSIRYCFMLRGVRETNNQPAWDFVVLYENPRVVMVGSENIRVRFP